jgi:hypothetical protein
MNETDRAWLRATSDGVNRVAERVNGEAEARSNLAGQFHEELAELIEFRREAHEAITLNEANITALTANVARLGEAMTEADILDNKHIQFSGERFQALSTALQAVWEVTQPRPSRWSRLVPKLVRQDIEARKTRACPTRDPR